MLVKGTEVRDVQIKLSKDEIARVVRGCNDDRSLVEGLWETYKIKREIPSSYFIMPGRDKWQYEMGDYHSDWDEDSDIVVTEEDKEFFNLIKKLQKIFN